jgi:hypothetical protein
MTRMQQDLVARGRGELNRDRGYRRLALAIETQRKLDTRRLDTARTKADLHGPSDPRHLHLTRAHD